jgi:hypothetical protein
LGITTEAERGASAGAPEWSSGGHWHIATDASAEDWKQFNRSNRDIRAEFVKKWMDSGSSVPSPLLGDRLTVVSAEFLRIGYCLFSPPLSLEERYDNDRLNSNKVARQALPVFVEAILDLPLLPSEIRDMLAYHSKQLLVSIDVIGEATGGLRTEEPLRVRPHRAS